MPLAKTGAAMPPSSDGEIFFQPRARGIAGARVVVALGLAQLFLRVGRGGEDGRSDGSGGRVGFIAGMDGASGKTESFFLGIKINSPKARDTENFTTEARSNSKQVYVAKIQTSRAFEDGSRIRRESANREADQRSYSAVN